MLKEYFLVCTQNNGVKSYVNDWREEGFIVQTSIFEASKFKTEELAKPLLEKCSTAITDMQFSIEKVAWVEVVKQVKEFYVLLGTKEDGGVTYITDYYNREYMVQSNLFDATKYMDIETAQRFKDVVNEKFKKCGIVFDIVGVNSRIFGGCPRFVYREVVDSRVKIMEED